MQNIKATVTLFLDQRRVKKNLAYPIKLSIYYDGFKERYKTGIDVNKEQWERLWQSNLRDDDLKLIKRKLNAKKEKAENIIDKMESFSFKTFDEIFFQEKKAKKSVLIKDLFQEKIDELEKQGRVGSSSIYSTVMNSLNEYKSNLKIHDITKKLLEDYEQHLLTKNHSPTMPKKFLKKKVSMSLAPKQMSSTTVGIYMRHLRAIVRLAIENKLLEVDAYPFKGYTIPAGRNIKKALKAPYIQMLLDYQTDSIQKRMGLDFWLFSYISNGMNFTDICLLKPESLGENYFQFYRAKTKNTKKKDLRPIKVPITDITRSIIQRWRNTNPKNPYLFPVLDIGLTPRQIKYKIQDFIRKVNGVMNSIGKELGIPTKINTYVARHSHSTILKRSGVPTEFIKENLGHSSVTTTENYLDDFEDEVKMEYAKLLTDFNK